METDAAALTGGRPSTNGALTGSARRRRLRPALAALADALGYEAAHLYVPGRLAGDWLLAEGTGRRGPWHDVVDPEILDAHPGGTCWPEGTVAEPLGERLADLGCRALAVMPVRDGTRVVLDACGPRGVPEHTEPDPALLDAVADAACGLGTHRPDELDPMKRMIRSIRAVLAGPDPAPTEILAAAAEALGADSAALVIDRTGTVEIIRSGVDPSRPDPGALDLSDLGNGVPAKIATRLAARLGIRDPVVKTAVWRPGGPQRELLLTGWAGEPAIDADALGVAAGILGAVLRPGPARQPSETAEPTADAPPDLSSLVPLLVREVWTDGQRRQLLGLASRIAEEGIGDADLQRILGAVSRLFPVPGQGQREVLVALARAAGPERLIRVLEGSGSGRLGAALLLIEHGSGPALRAVATCREDGDDRVQVTAALAASLENRPGV